MNHPHMVFDLEECEKLSSLKNKTNFIITTSQADIRFLMWSIFSIILRSKVNNFLEHINVVINGPDSRTGDPTLQNKKQSFLEELRDNVWKNSLSNESKNFPLTIIRVWSRIGAEQSLEMAIPWVHTDSYIYMHDDAIWLNNYWEEEFIKEFYKEKVAIVCAQDFRMNNLSKKMWENKPKLNFPHMHSACMAAKKPILTKLGAKWTGYHFKNNFTIEEKTSDLNEVIEAHKPRVTELTPNDKYDCASYDIGSWMYYTIKNNGYEINRSSVIKIHHFGSMSWFVHRENKEKELEKRLKMGELHIKNLEEEIKKIPEYWSLYNKYK